MKQLSFSPAWLCLVVFLIASPLLAEKPEEYTSLREVFSDESLRKDFGIQGEYLYKEGDCVFGLQVVAEGDGKFRCVAYPGGLPGEGWTRGDAKFSGTAESVSGKDWKRGDGATESELSDILRFTPTGELPPGFQPGEKTLDAKVAITRRDNGQENGQGRRRMIEMSITLDGFDPPVVFKKVRRTSPTLGEKAPEGALVVFDGSNLDQFLPGAKMDETQSRRGASRGNTLWAEAASKPFEKGQAYKMHLEFMLSYMPKARGQGRSNSGVYIDEAYECQVLDSFGLDGKNNECGGFYTIAEPAVNMCFPPLQWQTYDIDFTPPKFGADGTKTENARLTVKQNGVVIHDNIELPKETPGRKKEADEARGVYLQGHSNKVKYRNIWVKYE